MSFLLGYKSVLELVQHCEYTECHCLYTLKWVILLCEFYLNFLKSKINVSSLEASRVTRRFSFRKLTLSALWMAQSMILNDDKWTSQLWINFQQASKGLPLNVRMFSKYLNSSAFHTTHIHTCTHKQQRYDKNKYKNIRKRPLQ